MTNAQTPDVNPDGSAIGEAWYHGDQYRAMRPEQVADMFSFHPADTPTKRDAHEYARGLAGWVAQELIRFLPLSGDVEEAIKHLRMAAMFANAALAINGGPAGRMFAAGRKPELPDVDRAKAMARFEAFLTGATADIPPGQGYPNGSDELAIYDTGLMFGIESALTGEPLGEQALNPPLADAYRAGVLRGRHIGDMLKDRGQAAKFTARYLAPPAAGIGDLTRPEAGDFYMYNGDFYRVDAVWENREGLHVHATKATDRGTIKVDGKVAGSWRNGPADSDSAAWDPGLGAVLGAYDESHPPADPYPTVAANTTIVDNLVGDRPADRPAPTQADLDRAFGDHPSAGHPPRTHEPLLGDPAALSRHMALTNTVLALCAPAMLLADGDTPALSYYPDRKTYGLQLINRDGEYQIVRPADLKAGKAIVYPSRIEAPVRNVFALLKSAGYPVRSNEEPPLPAEDGTVDQVPGTVDKDRPGPKDEPGPKDVDDTKFNADASVAPPSTPGPELSFDEKAAARETDPVTKAREDLSKATAARRAAPKKPSAK